MGRPPVTMGSGHKRLITDVNTLNGDEKHTPDTVKYFF